LVRNRGFVRDRERAEALNAERLERAEPLALPELEFLELTVLVEEMTREGFQGDPGVSYLIRTDRGTLLFDVGFGPEHGTLAHNLEKLDLSLDDVEAVVISHLHVDHMGGMKAGRSKTVTFPEDRRPPVESPCFLPDEATCDDRETQVMQHPRLLPAGLGTTGPLARRLFFLGWTEEQSLVARVKDKGTVVITGCGHPTVPRILEMADRLVDGPLHTVAGGFHLPITGGRGYLKSIQLQTFLGTGKPPWQRVDDADLEAVRDAIGSRGAKRVLLSAHDSCDYALDRLTRELDAECEVLEVGATYRI
jgi:7,8-dihydropterin-6-yl-methyl-4-(beta-D-ribofuranosyl)aminobenzene 5'-phosphate synthase